MTAVDIYLPIESTSEWIHVLTIPHEDIRRLTFRPLKWLRFAIFTVCGAKGHLSVTPGGDVADYENISLDDLGNAYYYTPDGTYHFVDYTAPDDRDADLINSPVTSREEFQKGVQDRDHQCVFTRESEVVTVGHIIPASKGDAYITFVVRERFNLYVAFRKALIAFLKTPNFAMEPTDVESLEEELSLDRTTLQWMVDPTRDGARGSVPQWDALPDWHNQVHSPPGILLDYMYGVAVVKHWKTDRLLAMLEEWFERTYSNLLAKEQKAPKLSPPPKGKRKRRRKFSQDTLEGSV